MSDEREAGRREADRTRGLERWLAELWLSQARKEITIEEAVDRIQSRIDNPDTDGESRYTLALNLKWLLIEAGRFDDAVAFIHSVIEVSNDVRFPISLAELYLTRLDEPKVALVAIDLALVRAFETGDFRREALSVKARILLKLGRGEELGQVLEQIMSLKMAREFSDVQKERDFVDAAPPGLIREDIVARYDEFFSRPLVRSPQWDLDDPEVWMEYYGRGHHVVCPAGDPITPDELDQMIFPLFGEKHWRKTAYIISAVSHACEAQNRATTDRLIFARVLDLVAAGALESEGMLSRWRYSEIRPVRR